MREIRLYGSEGGGAERLFLPLSIMPRSALVLLRSRPFRPNPVLWPCRGWNWKGIKAHEKIPLQSAYHAVRELVDDERTLSELRICLYERTGRSYLLSGQHASEFQRIYRRLTSRMVIAHDKGFFRFSGHRAYAFPHSLQLLGVIEKVVSLIAIFRREPFAVISAMQAYVGEGCSHMLRLVQAVAQMGLVQVAEGDPPLGQFP